MTSRKTKRIKSRVSKHTSQITPADHDSIIETADMAKRERYLHFFIIAILFAFGTYLSVLYFGHQTVPNSDFVAFAGQGHEILSLKIPSSFKRAPVLGLIIASLSHVVGGQHPDLTAGWLLNAVLHPFNLILLYLVGKQIFGRSALWVSIVIIINPWLLRSLVDPILETTLVFFTLLTIYFIFRHSKWSYLLASITMMTRYEGAALIMAAFVMDMIYLRSKRERILAFVYSAIASVPLAIWMLGTFIYWKGEPSTHGHYFDVLFSPEYTKMFDQSVETRTGLVKNMDALWGIGFRSLFMPYVRSGRDSYTMLYNLSKFFALVSFCFGSVYGLLKRNWKILILLLYIVPYMCLHSVFQAIVPRYYVPVFWIAILICWFGLLSTWQIIARKTVIPKAVIISLQISIAAVAIIWVVPLFPYLPQLRQMSRVSVHLVYVAIGVVAAVFIARLVVYKYKYLVREFAILAVVCLIIVSNQFALAGTIGNGDTDIEFKLLADWYVANAESGEKLLSTFAHVIKMYAPEHADNMIHTGNIKAETPTDFVKACYEQGITYVAWDSRVGLNPQGRYHKIWGMKNIAMLSKPRSIGPYEFVTQIRVSDRRFINVFRLKELPAESTH